MHSLTEENYLKAIFKASYPDDMAVNTNMLAEIVGHKAPTVTDMLKRLASKNLIAYEKYKGVILTHTGKKVALAIIRKHRLWEVFLVEKLNLGWDEVHDIAEQLEHIQSDILIEKLDLLLGNPQFDPHGDPIPNAEGILPNLECYPLPNCQVHKSYVFVGIADHSTAFLKHLDTLKLKIGEQITLLAQEEYDKTCVVSFGENSNQQKLSYQVAQNILCS